MKPFLEAIEERVLVCDGAMGTMLYANGVFLNRCFDELNLTQPNLVAEMHQAYVRAGADVIETNTFGANRVKLTTFGLGDAVETINVQGARIARQAADLADSQVYVAGAMGPLGIRIEPWGRTGIEEAEAYFREQASALLAGGVDLFVLETFRDLNEIAAAVRAVRQLTDRPIVAQMTTEEDGVTLDGTPPEAFAPALEKLGANVIGLNCSVGPAAMLETVERMAPLTTLRLSAQPNAGKPRDVEGRNIYLCSPEYMASYSRRFIQNGVKLVGGCCGTTPDHIRAIKAAVRSAAGHAGSPGPSARSSKPGSVSVADRTPLAAPVARETKSRFANALNRGTFVLAVELSPPRGYQADELIQRARAMRIRGIDVINIPDVARAGGRMSALSMAVLIEQQAGIETLLHYVCRDRSLISMQSDLLGAHAMGLRNLLILTGEPSNVGDYPDATALVDVDSIGLTNVVARLNRGRDIGGQEIGAPTAFHVGVAANPGATDLDKEVRRFEYKVEAGAEFAVTLPIFDTDLLERFLRRIEGYRVPVLAGVAPLESLRQAEYFANEVPGVVVPNRVIERMRQADTAGRARAEGVAIAREVVCGVRGMVQGAQVTVSSEDLDVALEVVAT